MPSQVELAAQRIAETLAPAARGASVLWRWATVEAVNADGTMDVTIGGTSVPALTALRSAAGASVGDRVRVDYLGADAVVTGIVASAPTYAESTCTIESGATEYNVNACWSNGACCTVTLSVNLTSALANGGTVRIATAPSGYVPPYSVIGSCYVTGATAQVMAIIGTGGGITLNNRSGSSISTSANIYVSFTFVPA